MAKFRLPKRKPGGTYTPIRYWREVLWVHFRSIPAYLITLLLVSLLSILWMTLLWSTDAAKQPVGVVILLSIAFSTVASIIFYVFTFYIPLQQKRLKYYLLVHNSSAYMSMDITDFFKSLIKDPGLQIGPDFFEMTNLRSLIDQCDGLKPVRYGHTLKRFTNAFDCLEYANTVIQEKAGRLLLLNDILSSQAMYYLNMIINSCLTLSKYNSFARQSDMKFISLQACQVYLYVNLFGDQLNKDQPYRMIHHYTNLHNRLHPKEKVFSDIFFTPKAPVQNPK